MFHQHNFWAPFGDDEAANQAAQDALQPGAALAAARKVYDRIPAGRPTAEYEQRGEVDRLGADLDAYADRAGVDRTLFRETLQRKLRRDHGGSPNLSALPAYSSVVDEARDALERAAFDTGIEEENAATRLASAKRIHGERQQAHLAAQRALRDYDQAKGVQS